MKFFLLPLVLILTSCSLDKNSTYWHKDSINKSVESNEILKTLKKNSNFEEMTFDEFNLFIKDYSDKTDYPNINN